MKDLGLLILRLTFGGLLAGHGGQKLFGWFAGPGFKGTTGWLELMGMRPGRPWAALAGASEFGGGVLTALGFLNPIGPLATIGAMGMATTKVHAGKPIWVTSGGAELPVLNMAVAIALSLLRPGKYSLDSALHLSLPRRLILIPGLILTAGAIAYGMKASAQPQAEQAQPQAEQPSSRRKSPRSRPARRKPPPPRARTPGTGATPISPSASPAPNCRPGRTPRIRCNPAHRAQPRASDE